MLQPQMPFWGLCPEQVDPLWLELKFGLEAVLFNGDELAGENWKRFEEVIADFMHKGARPITLHFPMYNANYLEDPRSRAEFWQFLELAHSNSVVGVILHSNYSIHVEDLAMTDLPLLRERFLEFYAEVDRNIRDSIFWVGIENMPLMGNQGNEVDPIFIYPEDFAAFHFDHVKVVFDLCHWTSTVSIVDQWLKKPTNPHLYPPIRPCQLSDFLQLETEIVHLHLGAFKGIPVPPSLQTSTEGYVPGEGDLPSSIYRELLSTTVVNVVE